MSEPVCRNCSNTGRDMFGYGCSCGMPYTPPAISPIQAELSRLAAEQTRMLVIPDVSSKPSLKIKRLHPDAVIPSYAKPGDAGLDLTVIDDGEDVYPKGRPDAAFYYREYRTGLAMEIPPGHVGLIFPRSSQSNVGLVLANCVGVIDSGYRGEVKFRFKVDGAATLLKGTVGVKVYIKGERAGQLIVIPYPEMAIEEVAELSDTVRGTGGFGSSGS